MKNILITLLAASTLVCTPSIAGSGHEHAAKHGGIVREVSSVTYELVAKPDSLTLYVSDHDKLIATEGAKAAIALYAGSKKTIVILEPVGDNRMAAKGAFKVGVGVRAALTITLAGRTVAKTNFNLK